MMNLRLMAFATTMLLAAGTSGGQSVTTGDPDAAEDKVRAFCFGTDALPTDHPDVTDDNGADSADLVQSTEQPAASRETGFFVSLRHAPLEAVAAVVKQVFSDQVQIHISTETDTLFVYAHPHQHRVVANLGTSLDDTYRRLGFPSHSVQGRADRRSLVIGDIQYAPVGARPSPPKSDAPSPVLPGDGSRRYESLQKQAADMAARLRRQLSPAAGSPYAPSELSPAEKQELRDVVSQAFVARQAMQQAEIERLRGDLARIEDSIAAREELRDRIIDQRVEVLLTPELRWEEPAAPADQTTTAPIRRQAARRNPFIPQLDSATLDALRERLQVRFNQLAMGEGKLEEVLQACHDLSQLEGDEPPALQEHLARLQQLVNIGEQLVAAGKASEAELRAVRTAWSFHKSRAER